MVFPLGNLNITTIIVLVNYFIIKFWDEGIYGI